MKTPQKFEVEYKEVNVGYYTVEADSPEEAMEKFWKGVETGEFDLLKTDIVEADAWVCT